MNYQHTAGDRTPFTYVIRFPLLNQIYFGVKYAKGCKPDDLGKTYFSSSKIVHSLLKKEYSATFEIRKIFHDVNTALRYETRFLQRVDARNNKKFLNEHNNNGIYLDPLRRGMFGKKHSELSRIKQSEAKIGKKNPAFGKSGTMLGKKHSEKTKKIISLSSAGDKNWFFGKSHSTHSKKNLSEKQIGQNHWSFEGLYHTPFGSFGSCRDAERVTGIDRRKIKSRCSNENGIISFRDKDFHKEHHGKTFKDVGYWYEQINYD